MKMFPTIFLHYVRNRASRRNLLILTRFLIVLLILVSIYSVLFHFLMAREGHDHTWITGVYWTLTVMSTLGFGDITFHTDLGRIFSMIVLASGLVFLLVLLPFTFIEFFYEPWVKAQEAARVPAVVPRDFEKHVILTRYGPTVRALLDKLRAYHYQYVLLTTGLEEALRLHDEGVSVVVGELDDPDSYRRAGVERAALVVTTHNDIINTSVALTVREVSSDIPIVATFRQADSREILKLAGCTRVLQLSEMAGQTLARRALGGDSVAHVIGELDELLIAEANAAQTPLVGKSLKESRLRDFAAVTVVGVWDRGRFEPARPETVVNRTSVLVLAGSRAQLTDFDDSCKPLSTSASGPVVIIGGGRVGRAAARALSGLGIEYCIVDQLEERVQHMAKYVVGNAATAGVLEEAGMAQAPTVVITTRDDDTNMYMTIHCRRIRPDIQIISRAVLERNVAMLHRAGCDFVISDSSIGANSIFNLLKRTDIFMVAEGLDVFKMPVPASVAGETIARSGIRSSTGCSIIAIDDNGAMTINPDPEVTLRDDMEIVLIGTADAEAGFLEKYADH